MAATTAYRHEALVYRGPADFETKVLSFLRAGVQADEPMLVAVREPRLGRLRAALAGTRDLIEFVDMAELGANPAAIIPRWLRFVQGSGGRPVRGVGEPIWGSRSPEELVECQLHEALLNLAVPGGTPFRLVCPYDETGLPAPVLRECEASHPWISDAPEGSARSSPSYQDGDHVRELLSRPLPEPQAAVPAVTVTPADPPSDRHEVYGWARHRASGLKAGAAGGRVLAAVLTDIAEENGHPEPGPVRLRVWRAGERLVGEVASTRPLTDPLLGRRAEAPAGAGRAVWLANQVCDLTQLRGDERRTVIRVQVRA
jgi:hypothetical protein